MEKDNILSVHGLKVKFDNHVILDDISFEIKRDDTLAIIGPNGAGKSVLFRAILGLIPFEGKVEWAQNINVGYVPQKLFIGKDLPLTVAEFLQFKEKKIDKIHEVLLEVGFQKEAEHLHNDKRVLRTRIGALSGGELQRVLIAYALLGDPQVLLFDEPTAGVDITGEETIYSLIHKLQEKADLTIIFISHELQVVNHYASNVLCLNKEKICFGPPLKVIDKETLTKMYGEEVNLYRHHEH
ncbi:MAG: ABC transporter ATP-binding protein, zinc transport system ATP-binding protein [Microgenomates group bacterium GW2011_GWC1_39_7b]|uniref:ABC transporter related protein n=3 Tax=Candidatus Woeseibacteriota TaxID=1752722 RepID=A0A0G0LL56_9BACT|nr:MAG: ABC transporter related protein [Candidatus Woesebacteria bacterium GW2011_GWB1_39_10]KKR25975.1 MAG: ABC transporter ATP-binding protein, zinc transport system ATP-binding protein [Microgenomates group bacterium GW2011_GWC1_39_7b]KKR74381.1 MAG: ABC transporter related protein [Candidatus Woesebacteria bacterium GW2011_GWA2_40_7]KKS90763.1 MAG: ABC transporter related protein [Candidatus Woesebacteria bacterium GW2011_GWA1_43_12]